MIFMATEKVYTIPLRRDYAKKPLWRRSNRALSFIRSFISKHTKNDNVKIATSVNEKVWERGRNFPPKNIKVKALEDKGSIKVELFDEGGKK